MGWFLLVLAIVLEVSGTTCMKFSDGFKEIVPSVLVFVFYGLSFTAFIYALKTIDPSISYAIWAGLGLALITAIGIIYFKRPLKKRCGILAAGSQGVSPSFKSPPKTGGYRGFIQTISGVSSKNRRPLKRWHLLCSYLSV
jgi:small multidrug resistance pump